MLVLMLQRLMLVKLQRELATAMKSNIAIVLLYAPAVLRLVYLALLTVGFTVV